MRAMFGMREKRERLPLELEARNHLPRRKSELEDLQRDAAAHRRLLVRKKNIAHRAFTDAFDDPIRADLVWRRNAREVRGSERPDHGVRDFRVSPQEPANLVPQQRIGPRFEHTLALSVVRRVEARVEEAAFLIETHAALSGR